MQLHIRRQEVPLMHIGAMYTQEDIIQQMMISADFANACFVQAYAADKE